MKSTLIAALLSVASLLAVGSLVANDAANDAEKVDLTKIKCVVSGKPINPEASVKYKDALVYFCCQNCPKGFAADTKKFAAKANHQLVATRQAKQAACPMTGKELNAETAIEIDGVDVAFCCEKCQGAAKGKEGAEQLELVFGDKPFEKGFKIIKKTEAP